LYAMLMTEKMVPAVSVKAISRPSKKAQRASTMQTLLLPASSPTALLHLSSSRARLPPNLPQLPHLAAFPHRCPSFSALPFPPTPLLLNPKSASTTAANASYSSAVSTPTPYPPPEDSEADRAKLSQVSKRLENTSRYFKRLGSLGFWGQLVCTVVSAVILSFSAIVTGKITSPFTFYATAGSIAAAFVSVFWSFGYIRLSDKLRRTASDPTKGYHRPRNAPPRAEVVKSLKNGIGLNLLGMGAAILGMQATVGLLVAKALTSSAIPYYQGISSGYKPVLALDAERFCDSKMLVKVYIYGAASANTILSHFLGLLFSLELLRSVTLPPSEVMPIPKAVAECFTRSQGGLCVKVHFVSVCTLLDHFENLDPPAFSLAGVGKLLPNNLG
ncbi:hypothetical protein ACLOJK_000857, partial [Asimina triloba]